MTSDELELRLEQAWFDPAGLLLAWRDGAVVGSCWTKRHGEDVGEIYLIGLHPTAQGEGLGRQMVLTGLDDLYGRQNARDAMLYVDGANAAALALYAKLGFSAKSVIYRLRPSA